MELYEVMRSTFAARDFTADPVSDQVIFEILENARFAPSGGNRQGNRVIIIRNKNTRARLAELAEPTAKLYWAQVQAGESPWNTIIPTNVPADVVDQTPAPGMLTEPYISSQLVLVFLVDLKVVASVDKNLNRVGVISGASIYPFVWNVLMAARQRGFGGTITTLPIAEESEIKELLAIPNDFAVCALVPLGKPKKQLTKLSRRPVEEIATCERFDGKPFKI